MNIVVIKDKLKEALDILLRSSGDHPTLPILKNVFIEAKDDLITLITTNLEIGMKHILPGKIVRGGEVTVPAGLLSQIISNLEDERVELAAEESFLHIKTESYKASLQGSAAAEFPVLPAISNTEDYVEIEPQILKESIEAVLSATQFSELRPELSSVYFQFFGDRLVLVATDSFRLAEKTLAANQLKATTGDEFKVLLPLKTAQELSRVFKEKSAVKIYRDENQILFKTERLEMISRLLEGTFPDYRAVIPQEYDAEISMDRDDFLNAVKLAGVMSGAASEITLRPGTGDSLEIFSRDEKLGENSYQLGVKMKGGFKEATFNWKYLLEGVKAMPPKEIVFSINDNNKPAMLKSKQDASYFYILMPILKG